MSCVFEVRARGRSRYAALFPGWASDYRIFAALDIDYNYIVPIRFCPQTAPEDLAAFARDKGLAPVSIFGLSLGGFLGYESAARYPDVIDELIMIGIRQQYPPLQIAAVSALVKQNKEAFLRIFFRQCVSKQTAAHATFLSGLADEYARALPRDHLLADLRLLGQLRIRPETARRIQRLTIVHGAHDRIAPLSEARQLAEQSAARFLCFEQEGHVPLFAPDFSCRLRECLQKDKHAPPRAGT